MRKSLIVLIAIITSGTLALGTDCSLEREDDNKCPDSKWVNIEVMKKNADSDSIVESDFAGSPVKTQLFFSEKISCVYKLKNSVASSPNARFFSNLCIDIHGEAKIIPKRGGLLGSCLNPSVSTGNNLSSMNINDSLGYLWQKGECSPGSQTFFLKKKVAELVTKSELLKYKFMQVDKLNDGLVYYANPGYVIKISNRAVDCKGRKNCVEDSYSIIYKKRLNSAILDAGGKLYTNESL